MSNIPDVAFKDTPQKNTIVTADKVVLIDSQDWDKLKQTPATAFKGEKWDKWDDGINWSNGANWLDINWLWTYSWGTTYSINDAISYNWSSYICKLASTWNLPTNTTYFDLLAQKWTDWLWSGDMMKAIYDPANWAKQVAFSDELTAKQNTLVSWTNIKTINWESILWSGNIVISWLSATIWQSAWTATRVDNTNITISGDVTLTLNRWIVLKWTHLSWAVSRNAMIINSVYSAPNTTITIWWWIFQDWIWAIENLKYCTISPTLHVFESMWSISTPNATDISTRLTFFENVKVYACDLSCKTAWWTWSTQVIPIVNWSNYFTNIPVLNVGETYNTTTFWANSNSEFTRWWEMRIDIWSIQSTPLEDLYVYIYYFPKRYLSYN